MNHPPAYVLFTRCYWGILGNYRDLVRQARYLRNLSGIHRCCIEDIEVAQKKLKEIIESFLAHYTDEDIRTMYSHPTAQEIARARAMGLDVWAETYVKEGY